MTRCEYLTGRLLVAMPGMGDPRFDRSVSVVCRHDESGAFGIGIGHVRPDIRLHALLEDVGVEPGAAPDCAVHRGGPVEPGRGFVLHSQEWQGTDSVPVDRLCALSTSLDTLRAIARGEGPARWLIALGYAGWAAGQLDAEMRRHGWYAAKWHEGVVFDTPAERRWTATWHADGIDPALLANTTGSA